MLFKLYNWCPEAKPDDRQGVFDVHKQLLVKLEEFCEDTEELYTYFEKKKKGRIFVNFAILCFLTITFFKTLNKKI